MTKAKKYICILLIMITVLLSFSGCLHQNDAYNNTETIKFFGHLKQDTESSFGKKSAVYDGRIYFQGQAGIYSMLPDGSDIQKEADVKDIRKIQITDDAVYYAAYSGMKENSDGKIRDFDLFQQNGNQTINITESDKNIVYMPYDERARKDNIWDFYISSKGRMIVSCLRTGYSQPCITQLITDASYFDVEKAIDIRESEDLRVDCMFFDDVAIKGLVFDSDRFQKDQVMRGSYRGLEYKDLVIGAEEAILFDIEKNIQGISYFEFQYNRVDFQLQNINEKGYIFADEDSIILVDPAGECIIKKTTLEDAKMITFYLSMGDKAYIVAEDGSGVQSVYLLDVNTFEVTPVYSCDAGIPLFGMQAEKILSVTEDELVTVKDDTVKLHRIAGKEVLFEREIKLPQSIVKNSCKTDRAGDWLFVYDYNEEKTADELIFRVNIKTSEIF